MTTAQYDLFENLDKPVARQEDIATAQKLWDQLSSDRDSFAENLRKELLNGIR